MASIAAASIVAKVVRDRLMARLGPIYPAYGFETNAGYSTRCAPVRAGQRRPLPVPSQEFFADPAGRPRSLTRLNAR